MVVFRSHVEVGLASAASSALLESEIATIGVHGWASSMAFAACGAGAGVLAVAGVAGKLQCCGSGGGKAEEADCSGGNWQPVAKAEAAAAPPQGESWGVLLTPFLMAMVSIPALLGSWCWPLLVAVAFGASEVSTPQSRAVTHSVTWGMHIGALGALCAYVASRTPGDRAAYGPLLRWAPFALVLLGSLCMLLDLTRHLLLDQEIAPQLLHMYNQDHSLTFAGRLGVVCTWLGLGLLVLGTGWFLDYHEKIKSGWRRCFGPGSPAAASARAEA